jgi:pyrimidine-nucleoside phosphorylase
MRAVDIITKVRDGEPLTGEEIQYFVEGFTHGKIPDYQVSAWAMAVVFQGLSLRETTDLTLAMAASGTQLDLRNVVPIAADKHSTGGVGDKTTLVVQPIVAACGVPMAKMSGRGLGFTGGTLDKMESIPGYDVDLTTDAFLDQLREVGIALCGQTEDLAPADGLLYALRDVTGTVPSNPLIASSVMSKKLAAGANVILLDVKVGNGAFMKSLEEAQALARTMVEIGKRAGHRVAAVISDMNQPLGFAVGNALEVVEAVETLRGEGPSDFREHSLEIAARILNLASADRDLERARDQAQRALDEGAALRKFKQLVEAQGGDPSVVDSLEQLPQATYIEQVVSSEAGYIAEILAREVGLTAMQLGAGRQTKGDPVDHAVGVVLHHKVGDRVDGGEPLFTIHARSEAEARPAAERILKAHGFQNEAVEPLPLFHGVIEG